MKKVIQKNLKYSLMAFMIVILMPFLCMPLTARADSGAHDPHVGTDIVGTRIHNKWRAVTGQADLFSLCTYGGEGFLTKDIVITECMEIGSGIEVDLCLNGHSIKQQGTVPEYQPAFKVHKGGQLRLYDESGNTGRITHGEDCKGAGVLVDGGIFRMCGGTITNNITQESGGGVYISDGYFEMNGGNITNNIAEGSGGGVYISNGDFEMKGGNISNNSSEYGGGGIYSSGTFVNIVDGTIKENYAPYYGGGLFVDYGNTVTISGGNVSDNKCDWHGGGIFISYVTDFTVSGGTISGNSAAIDGGGLYATECESVTISGGEIKRNTAQTGGGGFFSSENYNLVMTGGTISGNNGNLYIRHLNSGNNTFKIDGTVIKDTTVSVYPGITIAGSGIITEGSCEDTIYTSNIFRSIKYNPNKGTGKAFTQYYFSEEGTPLIENEFTRSGFEFINWNTKADGSGTSYEDGEAISQVSMELYAQWKPAKYSVKFNANGGTGSMSDQSIKYDVSTALSKNTFTKEDARFLGWNTEANGSGTAYADGESVKLNVLNTNKITLYAQWKPAKYTVTFDANGGSGEMTSQSIVYDTSVVLSENTFTKTGYEFAGWNTKANGSGTSYADKGSVKLDILNVNQITLYAQWKAVEVSYKVNHFKQKLDGTYNAKPDETDALKGLTDSTVKPAVKSFSGFTSPALQSKKINGDGSTVVNYYYKRKSYTLTWDFAGGSVEETSNGTYTNGSVIFGSAITTPEPSKKGYTFAGWNVTVPATMPAKNLTIKAKWQAATDTPYKVEHYKQKLDGTYNKKASETETFTGTTNEEVTPEVKTYKGFISPVTKTVKIKADGTRVVKYYYERNSYTLTWDFAGGTADGTYTTGSVKYGEAITAPVPERTGYTFNGWKTEVPEKMPAKNLTIKATWKANADTAYKVEHYRQKVDGTYPATANETETLTGKTNASITPEVKTYKGFTAPETQTVKISADGTLVVKYYYTRNSYKLTWDFAGGKASGNYTKGTVKYGAKITAPVPTRDGYEFTGWDKTVASKMPAEDVTYKAKWRKLSQKEQVTAFVERFYTIILGRPAEAAGLQDWTNRLLKKEATGAQVAAGFINSDEFQKKKMTDEEYVTRLYRAFFDREPDKGGYEGWLRELKNGKSRDYVLRGFIGSPEFNDLCRKYGINTGTY